jgi:hypothetical protein
MIIGTFAGLWQQAFPPQEIPEILRYVVQTWNWLRITYPHVHTYEKKEPDLTDSLCEALNDDARKFANGIGSAFESETGELMRRSDGSVQRVGRTDIKVIFGTPGTPALTIEFKKLDGREKQRRRYCFQGIQRFIDGRYAANQTYGVMCGFTAHDKDSELPFLINYIERPRNAARLSCVNAYSGAFAHRPSLCAPGIADFDTNHYRQSLIPPSTIVLGHMLLDCPP